MRDLPKVPLTEKEFGVLKAIARGEAVGEADKQRLISLGCSPSAPMSQI